MHMYKCMYTCISTSIHNELVACAPACLRGAKQARARLPSVHARVRAWERVRARARAPSLLKAHAWAWQRIACARTLMASAAMK